MSNTAVRPKLVWTTVALPDCPRCEGDLTKEEAQVGQEEVGMYYCELCHIFYEPIDFADFDDRDE
tara:strand:- start:294 stop:488 length:195 start_codon:yes stop_codon:yes gene_type:complete